MDRCGCVPRTLFTKPSEGMTAVAWCSGLGLPSPPRLRLPQVGLSPWKPGFSISITTTPTLLLALLACLSFPSHQLFHMPFWLKSCDFCEQSRLVASNQRVAHVVALERVPGGEAPRSGSCMFTKPCGDRAAASCFVGGECLSHRGRVCAAWLPTWASDRAGQVTVTHSQSPVVDHRQC